MVSEPETHHSCPVCGTLMHDRMTGLAVMAGGRLTMVCTPSCVKALKADPARYLRVEGAGDEGEA